MKFSIPEYLKEEEESEIERIEVQEYEDYNNEYWYYNPYEDAGDRI